MLLVSENPLSYIGCFKPTGVWRRPMRGKEMQMKSRQIFFLTVLMTAFSALSEQNALFHGEPNYEAMTLSIPSPSTDIMLSILPLGSIGATLPRDETMLGTITFDVSQEYYQSQTSDFVVSQESVMSAIGGTLVLIAHDGAYVFARPELDLPPLHRSDPRSYDRTDES
jgi:hypothetical protein